VERIIGRQLPQVLEYCHSARSVKEYVELREDMDGLLAAWAYPTEKDALDIQQALWAAGMMRAAGAFDCFIAAYAGANDAVVLNSDRGFEYIETATRGAVRQEFTAE
jgi:predicted nucleic acid-binding protein